MTRGEPGLNQVIEGQYFPEIQTLVTVRIKMAKKVGVEAVVAVAVEELGELAEADPAIAVCVYGFEELPGFLLYFYCAVVVVSYGCLF